MKEQYLKCKKLLESSKLTSQCRKMLQKVVAEYEKKLNAK